MLKQINFKQLLEWQAYFKLSNEKIDKTTNNAKNRKHLKTDKKIKLTEENNKKLEEFIKDRKKALKV